MLSTTYGVDTPQASLMVVITNAILGKPGKIILGIIGVMFFPILLTLIGIDLLIDGIKNKDKGRITVGSFIIIALIIVMINISNDQSNSNQEVEKVRGWTLCLLSSIK